MILKNHTSLARQKRSTWIFSKGSSLLLVALFLGFLYLLASHFWTKNTVVEAGFTMLCDAENVEGEFYKTGEFKALSSDSQTEEVVYQGKYAMKLSNLGAKYGFSLHLDDVHVGDRYVFRVWVCSPSKEIGRLVVTGLDANQLYQESKTFEYSTEWQVLEVAVEIDKPLKENKLKVYCYNFNDQNIYFDNLAYTKDTKEYLRLASDWRPKSMDLNVNDNDYDHLKKKRHEAMNQGLLINSEDAWVKGAIFNKKAGSKLDVKLRLKGDWTDHLRGDKWSFRVVTETDKSWHRLKTFSLQTPNTRSYLYEWMLHEFYRYEDVLTTRYDFVDMKFNKKDLGLYVYEEHFLKQLPESSQKKEGPIIRFVEAGHWESYLAQTKLGADHNEEISLGSPEIKPFSENKTFKTPLLKEQFILARNLLYEYRYNLKPAAEIFDLDLLAKYYAIVDITGGYHGTIWHNQRFYYNPVIGKLEPIGFDGFGETGIEHVIERPYLGADLSAKNFENSRFYKKLFKDKDFLERYAHYLDRYSKKEYLLTFINSIEKDLNDRRSYIQKSKPDYKFQPQYILKRGANIQNALYPNSASIQTKTVQPGLIAVCNRHQLPIQIIGTKATADGTIKYVEDDALIYTTKFKALPDYSRQFEVPETAKILVYKVPGIEQEYSVEINKWPVPEAFAPVQELDGNLVENHPAYDYKIGEKQVLFHQKATIDTPIIIPKGCVVIVNAGTELDLVKNAFILSYSSVHFLGTEDAPILVQSSDKTARAFTVLQANEYSKINYTTFSGLGAFSYKGWNLPGSVNFYESDVNIYHSGFTRNTCEDALNIVRARFDFRYNTISHTFADGFDSDFCHGVVANCYFNETGNDAIDFSTSEVTIRDCAIINAGDKGISMGENGKAWVTNNLIDGAVIAIASKDLSQTTVDNCTIKNCNIGFAAYQKKPEYGEGYIYVNSYTAENLTVLHKIMPGSFLKLLNREIRGN